MGIVKMVSAALQKVIRIENSGDLPTINYKHLRDFQEDLKELPLLLFL